MSVRLVSASLVALVALCSAATAAPQATAGAHAPAIGTAHPCFTVHDVAVVGRRVFVDGQRLVTEPSVVFAPVPFGQLPSPSVYHTPSFYEPLLDLSRELGARVLRIPDLPRDARAFLCSAAERGFFVTAGFGMSATADYTSTTVTDAVLANFQEYVLALRDAPALIAYELGNELNIALGAQGPQLPAVMDLIERMAIAAQSFDPRHPCATVFGGWPDIGSAALHTDDAHLAHVPLLGVNEWRGLDLYALFREFPLRSAKALWISEWGYDTWDSVHLPPAHIDETQAAGALATMWSEIAYDGTAAIATVHELTQSAWKLAPTRAVNPGGWIIPNTAFEQDEEYFGLLAGDPSAPTSLARTLGFHALRELWTSAPSIGTVSSGTASVSLPVVNQTMRWQDVVSGSVRTNAVDPAAALFAVVRIPDGGGYSQQPPYRILDANTPFTLHAYFGDEWMSGLVFDVYVVLARNATETSWHLAPGPWSWPPAGLVLAGPIRVAR